MKTHRRSIGIMMCTLWAFVSHPDPLIAQKQINHREQIWLGYFNQTHLSERWGFWTDLHLRTKDEFTRDLGIGILRAGITYYLHPQSKLTFGYAYVHHFPNDGHAFVAQPEHRPWQQWQWHTSGPALKLMQWIRLEERYRRRIIDDDRLGQGYEFNFRVRYNFLAQIPLSRKAFQPGTFAVVLNDELHINIGRRIVYNTFDQNRFFTGLAFYLSPQATLQAGYMNVFQQLASGHQYRHQHVARIFFMHHIDLRSEVSEKKHG